MASAGVSLLMALLARDLRTATSLGGMLAVPPLLVTALCVVFVPGLGRFAVLGLLGLGRWLKASTALRLMSERPDVRFIETWNAGANEPMLAINRAMGFRPACLWRRWDLHV